MCGFFIFFLFYLAVGVYDAERRGYINSRIFRERARLGNFVEYPARVSFVDALSLPYFLIYIMSLLCGLLPRFFPHVPRGCVYILKLTQSNCATASLFTCLSRRLGLL